MEEWGAPRRRALSLIELTMENGQWTILEGARVRKSSVMACAMTGPTVRNGRAVSPQGRLPSAPLLTGLPPRCIPHCGRSAPPLSKGAFWSVRSRALPEYEKRRGKPPPNAPFTTGGGTAQAVTGDCLTKAPLRKACRGLLYSSALRACRTIAEYQQHFNYKTSIVTL